MAETITIAPLAIGAEDLALGAGPQVLAGAAIAQAPAATRWSLRARDPDVLAGLIGRALPQKIGETLHGIAKLGPDEWYALLPADEALPDGAGLPVCVVDVSSRAIGIRVEGQGAADIIGAGCPLDIAAIAPGRATRTVFETVEIVLWRESETRFHIEVWRSFAPWLWNALIASAG
ncbi:MAG TPA: sarcosine oxidase gamma subunit [Novosphingobium sp.]|nr:sarcosine oxidase gamma subunit [Novosphingobium sp.]HZV10429.1 sarcosine oxidase gamma subunit [Novosphingobium sp.]